MLGILIPAHNEEALIGQCLASIEKAIEYPKLHKEPVSVLVVLDQCDDGTKKIVEDWKVPYIEISAGNVGCARRMGVEHLLKKGVRWIACTDADTQVAEDWLFQQLALEADMVCGTVHISDWGRIPLAIQKKHDQEYQYREGHRHIHGANLGFLPEKYLESGGFQPLPAHEDVALVKTFEKMGAHIAWSDLPRVYTSARLDPRAQEGFGNSLREALKAEIFS